MKRKELLPHFEAMVLNLLEDHFEAQRRLRANDSPFERRTHVRTAFSMVEGITFQMKRYALAVHADSGPLFDENEIALLNESAADLDSAGKVTTRPKFLPLKRDIRFACAAFARVNQSTHHLDVGGPGWEAFQGAVDIRNAVVHPKTPADLELTDVKMQTVQDGIAWFHEQTQKIITSVQPSTEPRSDQS